MKVIMKELKLLINKELYNKKIIMRQLDVSS